MWDRVSVQDEIPWHTVTVCIEVGETWKQEKKEGISTTVTFSAKIRLKGD